MKNKSKILPVLFGFFIMGFCGLVGVSVTYAKDYFSWSETQAGFLPSMVFIWFLLISIPISIWMDKKGRKTISLIGLFIYFYWNVTSITYIHTDSLLYRLCTF